MIFLDGNQLKCDKENGETERDQNFLVIINASADALTVTLPDAVDGEAWKIVPDTAASWINENEGERLIQQQDIAVESRSLMVLVKPGQPGIKLVILLKSKAGR